MTPTEPAAPSPFPDEDMPSAWRAADNASLAAQWWATHASGTQLSLFVAAALAGAIPNQAGAIGAVVLFLIALAASLYLATEDPDRTWYLGRAGAESVKSLAWRYASGGDPFPITGLSRRDADLRFEEQLRAVCAKLADLDWSVEEGDDEQITATMLRLRESDLATRKTAYATGRIDDQHRYYAKNSDKNRRRASFWRWLALIVTFAGLIAGIVRIVEEYDVDLLGLAAVAAASITAWAETRQYRTLGASYASSAQDLSTISIRLRHIELEEEWAAFVRDAELAISREHTLWLTRHGVSG